MGGKEGRLLKEKMQALSEKDYHRQEHPHPGEGSPPPHLPHSTCTAHEHCKQAHDGTRSPCTTHAVHRGGGAYARTASPTPPQTPTMGPAMKVYTGGQAPAGTEGMVKGVQGVCEEGAL